MESRKGHTAGKLRKAGQVRSGHGLPHDFLEMVQEVFTTHFDQPLQKLIQLKGGAELKAHGDIFPDEIILSVSVVHPGQLAATTAHASVDFDPKASAPNAQDLLNACVDAIASVYGEILVDDQEKLEAFSSDTLSALENIPFEWTPLQSERFRIFVKVDKSNPDLDQAADDWLAQHDPASIEEDQAEQSETEKLFVTGPKAPKKIH